MTDMPEVNFDGSEDSQYVNPTTVVHEMIRPQGNFANNSPAVSTPLLCKPSPSQMSSLPSFNEEKNLNDQSFSSILEEHKAQVVAPEKTMAGFCNKMNTLEEHCRKDEQEHTPSDIIKRQKKQHHPDYLEFDSFKSFTSLQLSSNSADCNGEFTPKDFQSLEFGMDHVFMSRKTTSFDSYFESLQSTCLKPDNDNNNNNNDCTYQFNY